MNRKQPPWKRTALLAVPILLVTNFAVAQDAEPVEEIPQFDESAMNALGFAMGSQLGLMIGFSDEEFSAILEGMKLAAKGEEPENFQEAIQRAQTIYMAKRSSYQAEQAAIAQREADENSAAGAAFFAEVEANEGVVKTESGLLYEIVAEGEGELATDKDIVKINYTGTLVDGTEFDSGEAASFPVNRVVPGFSEGLKLVKPGGKIKLYIPSDLGYGDAPQRPGSVIKPGDYLIFDVELLEVQKAPTPPARTAPGRPQMSPPSGPPSGPPPTLPPGLKPPPPPPSGPPPSRGN